MYVGLLFTFVVRVSLSDLFEAVRLDFQVSCTLDCVLCGVWEVWALSWVLMEYRFRCWCALLV